MVVDIADNGLEGIKRVRNAPYDLILMDLQMPLINGYEAVKLLQEEGFDYPIVALTAHTAKGVKEKCLSVGCTDYLSKPINAQALLEMVSRYHNRKQRYLS